jgi:crotonobetainyl-CoA:carnitine CoA-transferase CaiB-like acyl-CoA transferase
VRCDVVITNLLPARRRRYGLEVADLHALKPDLVIGLLTGYGEQGDEIDRPGYDLTAFFSRGGLVGITPDPAAGPFKARPGQGDHTAGLALFGGVMAALRTRDQGGGGQVVEVSLLRTATWTAAFDLVTAVVDGRSITPRGRESSLSPLMEAFLCADGRWIQLAMADPATGWAPFCRAIGRPDLIDHDTFSTPKGRYDNMRQLIELLDGIFLTQDLAVWGRHLDDAGCVWAPVNRPTDVVVDPQVRASGAFEVVDHPDGSFETVAAPFRMPNADARVRGHFAGRGADTTAVLTSILDLDAATVARLRADGIIGGA